jgi:hypothetical protein
MDKFHIYNVLFEAWSSRHVVVITKGHDRYTYIRKEWFPMARLRPIWMRGISLYCCHTQMKRHQIFYIYILHVNRRKRRKAINALTTKRGSVVHNLNQVSDSC